MVGPHESTFDNVEDDHNKKNSILISGLNEAKMV